MYSFSPATSTPRGCTQLPLAHWRLHCLLQNGRGKRRQLHCLRFLRSSRQVDCAHKTLQLTDLSVLIHSLAIQRAQLNIPLSTSPTRIILTHQFGVDSALAALLQARSTELNWPGENLYYHWFQVGLYTGKEGRDSSVDRARDPWWGGRGFDPYSCQTLSLGWVGVSIMLPSWLPRSVSCVAARKIVRLQSWDPSADIA